jgi:hypothetical protein
VQPPSSGGGVSEPKVISAVFSPDQLSTKAGVVGTNIVLASIILIALLFSSELFNATLKEHRKDFEAFFVRLFAPVAAFLQWLHVAGSSGPLGGLLGGALAPLVILPLTGAIYLFNSPDVAFDQTTLAYFLSLVIGLGIVTYVYEGGEALLTTRRFGTPAAVRLLPIAPLIAIAFVALSRITGFEAPIMFGFVATATLLIAADAERREGAFAFAVLVPAIVLLVLSLAAWGLLIPLRDVNDDSSWWSYVPSNTAALVFAAGIEGLVFTMIPLTLTDGSKIFRWYRLLWFPLFFIPAFIFVWAILNPEAQALDSLLEGRLIVALCLVAAYVGLALALWAYFALFARSEHAPPHAAS